MHDNLCIYLCAWKILKKDNVECCRAHLGQCGPPWLQGYTHRHRNLTTRTIFINSVRTCLWGPHGPTYDQSTIPTQYPCPPMDWHSLLFDTHPIITIGLNCLFLLYFFTVDLWSLEIHIFSSFKFSREANEQLSQLWSWRTLCHIDHAPTQPRLEDPSHQHWYLLHHCLTMVDWITSLDKGTMDLLIHAQPVNGHINRNP